MNSPGITAWRMVLGLGLGQFFMRNVELCIKIQEACNDKYFFQQIKRLIVSSSKPKEYVDLQHFGEHSHYFLQLLDRISN